jgi:putative aldouronate transport system permease protein
MEMVTQMNGVGLVQDGTDKGQSLLLINSMKYALIIVSTLPIMCLYPFIQRYFVKGVMIGSIKG